MLESVKNKIQRQSLYNLLKFIVDGTKSEHGFVYVPREEAEKLQKADASLIVVDPTVVNPDDAKQIKVYATQAAIDGVDGKTTVAPSNAVAVKGDVSNYEFVKLEAIPEIMRGSNKSDSYPFDKLKPFPQEPHAFFVPATESRPNPAKSLASTVASATKRYSKGAEQRVFTVRKHTDASGKVDGAHVIRTK